MVGGLKGQCHQTFDFRFSTWVSFPQAPDYTIRAVSNLFKNLWRYLPAQGAPPVLFTPVPNGKNQKSFHYFFWTYLDSRVSTKITFSFKFILSCQQSDIVPIVCHRCCWYWWQFARGVIDTGGKFVTGINNISGTCGKICHGCCWHWWCTLTCKYLREFSKKIRNDPRVIFRGLGEDDS